MKLQRKISLICSVVLVVIVLLMSGLLLLDAKQSIMDLTYQQSSDKQRSITTSFSTMANYYLEGKDFVHGVVIYFLAFSTSPSTR